MELTIVRDVLYVENGVASQSLDLYLPQKRNSRLPLVIWIHGGAFLEGSKEPNEARFLTEFGFAAASINYRLTNEARSPAQVQDCKAAVRFLRAHADEYGLDTNRFGVWGASAGGFLAAMLGTTGTTCQFNVGGHLNMSSQVQAVCDWFGPTDFTTMDGPYDNADRCNTSDRLKHFGPDSPAAAFLGYSIELDLQAAFDACPIAYVSSDAPPFLIMHGDEDPMIPLNQSRQLADALEKVGADAKLVILARSGHGDGLFRSSEAISMVSQFFVNQLK